ncbi:hypothetical protein ACF09H_32075 [Streptomyces sp. NPDC014983]|uniref:hypothetical protein n=1 Tax=Streptomyces TaxID=1883 RepID=UPI0034499431
MTDPSAALELIVGAIRDREGWARTGSAVADARNDGELAGLYIALDALTGSPYPHEEAGRRAYMKLRTHQRTQTGEEADQ